MHCSPSRSTSGPTRHEEAARTTAYLDTITSATALCALSSIAAQANYAEIRVAAPSCLELIAEAYGMTRGQLEDSDGADMRAERGASV